MHLPVTPPTNATDPQVRTLDFSTTWEVGEFCLDGHFSNGAAKAINEKLRSMGLDADSIVGITQDGFRLRVFYKYQVERGNWDGVKYGYNYPLSETNTGRMGDHV